LKSENNEKIIQMAIEDALNGRRYEGGGCCRGIGREGNGRVISLYIRTDGSLSASDIDHMWLSYLSTVLSLTVRRCRNQKKTDPAELLLARLKGHDTARVVKEVAINKQS
jgi:hypothetical protein